MAAVITVSSVASSRSRIAICRPSRMTSTRSLIANTSGSSDEIMMMPIPSAASSPIMAWTSVLAPTSMPRVGSSRISSDGWVFSHLLSITFCWLPPESLATASSTDGVRIASRLRNASAVALSNAGADQAEAVEVALQARQRDVGRDRHRQRQAELAPVLREVGDAVRHRFARRADLSRLLPFSRIDPGGRRLDAEERKRDIGASGADQSGEAQDLAAPARRSSRPRRRPRGRGRGPTGARRPASPACAA